MHPVEIYKGSSPLILAMPHTGAFIPPEIEARLNERGLARADTDWHIDRLYDGLAPGASIIKANFHRYVIDPNRDPSGASLYPGQNTTGLCPLTDFHGEPIYRNGEEPSDEEIEQRRISFHAPYHEALCSEIERVRAEHGVAVLYDCHSIASEVPYLFDGTLPDLNIGTNDGATCALALQNAVTEICASSEQFTHVVNGRFRGGWTTRHYGRPATNVHAIQMELAQSAYMEERAPWTYDAGKAEKLRSVLRDILAAIATIAQERAN